MRAAERQLDAIGDRAGADQLAFEQCDSAIAVRNEHTSRVWCAIASRRAVSRIDAWGGPRPGPELDTVRRALWLNAVDGLQLQNNPWWGSPRSETISFGGSLREPAYTLIAVIQRKDVSLAVFRLEILARWVGVNRERKEKLGPLRQRTLNTLRTTLPTDESARVDALWAVAAVAMTIAIQESKTDNAILARDVLTRIRGLAETAEGYGQQDAMLAPALYLAEGWAGLLAGEYETAERALDRGTDLCSARLWDSAAMCKMLDTAYVQSVAAVRAPPAIAPKPDPGPVLAPKPSSI